MEWEEVIRSFKRGYKFIVLETHSNIIVCKIKSIGEHKGRLDRFMRSSNLIVTYGGTIKPSSNFRKATAEEIYALESAHNDQNRGKGVNKSEYSVF